VRSSLQCPPVKSGALRCWMRTGADLILRFHFPSDVSRKVMTGRRRFPFGMVDFCGRGCPDVPLRHVGTFSKAVRERFEFSRTSGGDYIHLV
jgi:hypothetical protein